MRVTFCPHCGRKLGLSAPEGRERRVCDAEAGGCGYIDFGRFTVGVGGLVLDRNAKERRVLLIQRNQEPNKGGWTIPGGFVEANETVEVAVVREVDEETGLRCRVIGLVGFRNRVDPDVNASYVVFLLEKIAGQLASKPTDEIVQAGFYTFSEIEKIDRVTPLSRELAAAALFDRLKIVHPLSIPQGKDRPSVLFFMG